MPIRKRRPTPTPPPKPDPEEALFLGLAGLSDAVDKANSARRAGLIASMTKMRLQAFESGLDIVGFALNAGLQGSTKGEAELYLAAIAAGKPAPKMSNELRMAVSRYERLIEKVERNAPDLLDNEIDQYGKGFSIMVDRTIVMITPYTVKAALDKAERMSRVAPEDILALLHEGQPEGQSG